MPGWHKAIQNLSPEQREKVQIVGIIQEQHADRCQLFAQWHQFDWPILHDPINSLGLRAVPVTVAIDEYGIVRDTKPNAKTFANEFLEKRFAKPHAIPQFAEALKPDLKRKVGSLDLVHEQILWGDERDLDEAIMSSSMEEFQRPQKAPFLFRLGVAYRKESETEDHQDNDFENAIRCWSEALEIDPNNYIYRRRIQQYGPRLDKPYPFYDWVDQAIADIKARGGIPVELKTMPTGAEIAKPTKKFQTETDVALSPDADGKIDRDTKELVDVNSVVVPVKIKPGKSAMIHLQFRIATNEDLKTRLLKAKWNNEGEPMQVWIDTPKGGQVQRNLWKVDAPTVPESTEQRTIEFEIKAPEVLDEPLNVRGYALFNICETDGECLYLRKDFEFEVPIENK